MDPERAERARQIFGDALEAPAANRAVVVARQCGGDADLAARVRSLLAAHDRAGAFMEGPTVTAAAATGPATPAAGAARRPPGEGPGARIGPYTLRRAIGEGGFGTVFEADQERPLKRRVALKVIKAGMDTRAVIARFDAERAALALMEHPNIATVLDAGATASGRPYFVMELVAGVPITRFCDDAKLAVPQRLALFVTVCRAVQHAHQKGVIHRDIKPGNVLVGEVDGRPVAKVIDFGIAKATGQGADAAHSVFTAAGQMIGTPAYMSPEQTGAEAGGGGGADAADVDTRSDVYSLGVLLYELLTGTTPFDVAAIRGAGFSEVVRVIREVDPPRPSARLGTMGAAATTVAARRRTASRRLSQRVRGDLDWIVMRCLEKDRTRRYESVGALAEDVRRYLADEPVDAGPPSRRYRLRKFARRNKGLLGAAAGVAAALVIGLAVATAALVRERAARAEAERAAGREATQRGVAEAATEMEATARRVAQDNERKATRQAERAGRTNQFLQQILRSADPRVGKNEDLTVRQVIGQTVALVDGGAFKDQPEIEAAARLTLATTYQGLGDYAAAARQAEAGLALRRRVLGPDHLDVAEAMGVLALARHLNGDYPGAEDAARRALAIHRRLEPGGSVDMASCLGQLAITVQQRDKLDEALGLFEESLAMSRRLQGPENGNAALVLNNLAMLHRAGGRYGAAEARCREALAMERKLNGGFGVTVAGGLNNLGTILEDAGKPADALVQFGQAEEMFRKLYPGDHPQLAVVMHNVAHSTERSGRPVDALPKYREAIGMLRRTLGDGHPDLAQCLKHYGECLQGADRAAESAKAFEELAAVSRAAPRNATVGTTKERAERKIQEAEALIDQGLGLTRDHRPDEAAAPFERAAGLLRDAEADPALLSEAVALLALNRLERGKDADAAPLVRDCLNLPPGVAPPGRRVARAAMIGVLGGAKLSQKLPADARALLLTSYDGLSDVPAEYAFLKRAAVARLVRYFEAVKDEKELAAWRAEARRLEALGALE